MGIFNKITPEKIEKMEEKKDVNGLIKALQSKDSVIRKLAAEALGNYDIRDAASVKHLIPLLKDENVEARKKAAQTLGFIKDKRAVKSLIETLKDSDPRMRENVISALGSIGDVRAVEPLLGMLNDDISDVRFFAVSASGELRDQRAVQPLLDILQMDPESLVRGKAAEALGELNDPQAIEPLYVALMDKEVYYDAARALLKISDASAIDALCKAMTDDFTLKTKLWIAEIVIRAGNDKIVEPIIQFLKEYKDDVCYQEVYRFLFTAFNFMEWEGENSQLFKSLYEKIKERLGIEED